MGAWFARPWAKRGLGAEQGFGRNPTDRGKLGSKRHGLTSGEGLPVASIVTAANVNDVSVLAHLLDARVLEVPEQVRQAGVHLCIDGGYDNRTGHAAARERGLQVHVQPKPGSEQAHVPEGEPRHPARHWVVEVTHAWLNRWRRVQTRWEKRLGHYAAFVELAICMLIWRNIRLKSA